MNAFDLDFPAHIWAPFAQGRPPIRCSPGYLIYLQGTEATCFYYLKEGQVRSFIQSEDGAERALILFLPDWMEPESAESPIRCLRTVFRVEEKVNHRDLLGSLMGLGIVREKVGDILVGPDSADLLVLDTVTDFLLSSWTSAGRAKLTVAEIDPSHLHMPEIKCEEVRDTVSSLRLDAVASTGFRMARSKAADLIASGRVQVNWRECTKPDKLLVEGDTVSARGFGKFQLAEVGGVTKKGRTAIVVKRYV